MPPPKRTSGRAKKEVNYAAMHELKIEEIEQVDTEEIKIEPGSVSSSASGGSPPAKKQKKSSKKKDESFVTEGKCGKCVGCNRSPCSECSFCLNGDAGNCIDLYCTNQSEGRAQREAAREAYLMSLGRQQQAHDSDDDIEEIGIDEDGEFVEEIRVEEVEEGLSVKEQIDKIMEGMGVHKGKKKDKNSEDSNSKRSVGRPKVKPTTPQSAKANKSPSSIKITGVYGGSSNAAKVRRCGECEGCMMDDCGTCINCQDKVRFGGKGTKKKACVLRYCRTRKMEEDHAAANFPLTSPDVLKKPRPVSRMLMNKQDAELAQPPAKKKPKLEPKIEAVKTLPAAGEIEDEFDD